MIVSFFYGCANPVQIWKIKNVVNVTEGYVYNDWNCSFFFIVIHQIDV